MDTELQRTVDKIIQDKDLVKKEAEAKLGLDEDRTKKASGFCHKGSKKNGGLVHQLGRLTIERKTAGLFVCHWECQIYYLSRTYLFLIPRFWIGRCHDMIMIIRRCSQTSYLGLFCFRQHLQGVQRYGLLIISRI